MLRLSISSMLLFCVLAANAWGDFEQRLDKSKLYLDQGQYRLALDEAIKARQEAETEAERARADGAAGNAQLILKLYDQAEKSLLRAFENAGHAPREQAGYANNLGILYSALDKNRDTCSAVCQNNELDQRYSEQDKVELAEKYFVQALRLAEDDRALMLEVSLNRLHNRPETANNLHLQALSDEIFQVGGTADKVRHALSFAAIIQSAPRTVRRELGLAALERARTEGEALTDTRLRIELLNRLAENYERGDQQEKALAFSEQATDLPVSEDVRDVLIDLEWRKGRIYQQQGRDDLALVAFGNAVDYVEAIRLDIPVEYHEGHSSFRETLEPIYLGYAYHLLKKASTQQADSKQRTLLLARQTVEQIKQSEMEDFLGGRCFIESLRKSDLDNRDRSSATVYPIILPDRLELLVNFDNAIHQYTIPVEEKQLRDRIVAFAEKLRNRLDDYQKDSEKLYRWLVAPLEADLDAAGIKTLVVVPDGPLRLVPFAALSDGRHFVIEKYAVSVSPGMSLMSGGNANSRSYHTLLVGLSRPGSVVEKLPAPVISAILGEEPSQSSGSQRGLRALGNATVRGAGSGSDDRLGGRRVEDMIKKPGAIDKLKEQLSLPGVEEELQSVKQTVTQNTLLLNDGFTLDSFQREMASQPYEVVHIASHGIFTSDAETSFIMAHDNLLKIDDLHDFLKGEKADRSIDLLTLSACETAEGDDRAPLGFTSVALKANAKSAIGSLWPISDAAAAQLMGSFYKHLTRLNNKAEALRQSQLEFLQSSEMSHPFFWSPFILVGNWI